MTVEEELKLVNEGREYCLKELGYYRSMLFIAQELGRSRVEGWEDLFKKRCIEAGIWRSA